MRTFVSDTREIREESEDGEELRIEDSESDSVDGEEGRVRCEGGMKIRNDAGGAMGNFVYDESSDEEIKILLVDRHDQPSDSNTTHNSQMSQMSLRPDDTASDANEYDFQIGTEECKVQTVQTVCEMKSLSDLHMTEHDTFENNEYLDGQIVVTEPSHKTLQTPR